MTEESLTTYQMVELYYSQARRFSNPWHNQIKKRRKLYDMDHYQNRARQGEERYEDPTYTNIVDIAVGIILANDLTFRVHGWAPSSDEQSESDQVEKFLAGLLQVNSERAESYLPYDVLLNFVRDGMAVLYTVWDEELAAATRTDVTIPDPDQPDSPALLDVPAYREPPLRVQTIDPLKIFLIPGGPNRWLHVFRVERKSVLDVEIEYGVRVKRYLSDDRSQKERTLGELIDYWRMADQEQGDGSVKRVIEHAIVFEGEEIQSLVVMEGYDDLPFTIGFFKPVDKDDPKKWSHSIIDPLESTIAMLERAVNRRQFQITRYSALPLTAYVQPGRTVQLDGALGQVQMLNPEERLEFPKWEGSPPDVGQQMEFLRARAQQSGFSDVMFGAGAGGMSGYGLSQLGDQNRIRLEQPVQHLQLLWARWAKKALRLCEHFASDSVVRVYGRMRGRDFLDQVFTEGLSEYNVQVLIKPEFPNDQTRKHAMATQVRSILSEHTLMERYLDIEQPDDERQKKLIEQMENHPMMIERAVIRQLREAAEEGDEDAAVVLERMLSQSGEAPPPKPPVAPNPGAAPTAPNQLMGAPSPTGGITPQEAGMLPPGQGDGALLQQLSGLAPNMGGGFGD